MKSSAEARKRKPIRKIPVSRLSRGMRLARLTAEVGAQAIGGKMSALFGDRAQKEAKRLLSQVRQARKIADALGQMKGAAMKLGQLLSLHGEQLFPKEVAEVLALLQGQSDEMEFERIEKVLRQELGKRYGTELVEVSQSPIAAASIGQVHRAVYAPGRGGDRLAVAVKVQYPGVDRSIESDVDALASMLGVLTRFPNLDGFRSVSDEIKSILRQETDYLQEGRSIEFFRAHFARDPHVVVPRHIPEVSTRRVLTTELADGISVREFSESVASPQARAFLGAKYLEIFYEELFGAGRVQSDPNFANYKIRWSFGVPDPKLVLLDFGAVKQFDENFRAEYKRVVRACLRDDYEGIRRGAIALDFLREDDPKELVDMHHELVRLFMEPFRDDRPYPWHENDLADRIRRFVPQFIFSFKLRPPPRDFIFLDRKIVGVYLFCSAIKAVFNPRPVLISALSRT